MMRLKQRRVARIVWSDPLLLGKRGFFLLGPVMLIVCQFPICDGRPFSPTGTSRLSDPPWPLPTPGTNFVRCFGPVERRRRGGHEVFVDEVFYASASGALKFQHLERQELGTGPATFRPYCAFRRLFCNGSAVVRLEVGITDRTLTAGSPVRLYGHHVEKIVLDLLELPVQVTQFMADPVVCSLWGTGKPVADLYASATAAVGRESSGSANRLVVAGEPLLLIEYTADEIQSLPERAQAVDPQRIGGANLSFLWLEYRRRRFGLWFLRRDAVDAAFGRRLRLGLLRLHAEHQVLKYVLSLLSKGVIGYAPHTDAGNAFDAYLNEATRVLLRRNHAGLSQAAIREVIAAYQLVANLDEQSLLAEKLEQVRRQIRRKVVAYTRPASSPGALPAGFQPQVQVMVEKGEAVSVFISYSHQDAKYLQSNSLLGFISGLAREHFNFWYDERIETGDLWDDRICEEINRADIALILVSQAFLNSRYCQDKEVVRFVEGRRQSGLKTYPIILSPCDWNSYPWLAATQFQPRIGTIETSFRDGGKRKALYLKILEELRELGNSIRAKR